MTSLPGIGKTLEEKLVALLETGTIPAAVKLRAKYPPGLLDMTRLPGLGPKRARKLFDELGIDSLDALRAAAEGQRLRGVKGFGPKFEASVLSSLDAGIGERPGAARAAAPRAGRSASRSSTRCARIPPPSASSSRARRAARPTPSRTSTSSRRRPTRARWRARSASSTSSSRRRRPTSNAARGRTHTGLPVDLRVVEPENFGNLLQHFTGSAAHNVALREAAVRRGLHVSEYGILDDETGETLRCATEEEVYERLGLDVPRARAAREPRRAVAGLRRAAARHGRGPARRPAHAHARLRRARHDRGDGARRARAAATSTSRSPTTRRRTASATTSRPTSSSARSSASRRSTSASRASRSSSGTETNILPDGSPDYDDELLARLDWVIGSVHTSFGMPAAEMTKRMVAAIEHPWIDAIGHPTGRKISTRQPYALDLDAVIAAAARTRHDARDQLRARPPRPRRRQRARRAPSTACCCSSTPTPTARTACEHVRWGIATARRAWLTAEHVANTRPWPQFAALRKRARARRAEPDRATQPRESTTTSPAS